MKTKKQFREYLNWKHGAFKWTNGPRRGQQTRLYGDYLYSQDIEMFNMYYREWLNGTYE